MNLKTAPLSFKCCWIGLSLSILGAKVAVLSTATARVVYTLAVRVMWIRGTRTGVARSRGWYWGEMAWCHRSLLIPAHHSDVRRWCRQGWKKSRRENRWQPISRKYNCPSHESLNSNSTKNISRSVKLGFRPSSPFFLDRIRMHIKLPLKVFINTKVFLGISYLKYQQSW